MAEANPYNVKPTFPDKYYVYALCKPNGDVFYVGKGKRGRVNHHFQNNYLARSNSSKNQTIRKYGNSIKREILCYFDDETSAYDYEEWLISYYGLESEGGCLRQYAKTRNQYSEQFISEVSIKNLPKPEQKEYSEDFIISMYREYFTKSTPVRSISLSMNIPYSYVSQVCTGYKCKTLYKKYILSGEIKNERNNKRPNKSRGLTFVSDGDILTAIQEYKNGVLSFKDASAKLGISKETLKKVILGELRPSIKDKIEGIYGKI